jgi:AmmeMemoRadiSam system protein B
MIRIREAAVAGYFYPAGAGELSRTIHEMLGKVSPPSEHAPKALIVPHAGYVYSGPVAATAYNSLRSCHKQYTRVVLIGPSHRVPFEGLATSSADAFRTPLGDVPLDRESLQNLELPGLIVSDEAHQAEHSLEVHLPFLQVALDAFLLVPVVCGDCDTETVARLILALWGGPETLIVVSSDLSHYLPWEDARARDQATCEAIERFDARSISHEDACGATPVNGLLIATRRLGLSVKTLDLRNSGDTAGNREQVVGYGSWLFFKH